jgi:NitT/TauT family transport system substrate-binding protein
VLAGAACQPARYTNREPPRGLALRVNLLAYAPYAPLIVMKERGLVQQRVPGLSVEWKVIPKVETLHEALLTGGLDVAVATATTFLLTRASGIPVRALAAVSELPIGIVANRPEARSLRDLRQGDRLAVPDAESHEATQVRIAALRELGDPRALDGLMVGRSQGEGLAALLSRQGVTAQAAITPYLDLARDTPGVQRLDDAAGLPATTTLVAYTLPALRERRRPIFDAFVDALTEAATLVTAAPESFAKLTNEVQELDVSAPALAAYLRRPGVGYGTRFRGLTDLAGFLTLTEQIRSPAPTWGELTFEGAAGT